MPIDPAILAVGRALPPHPVDQEQLLAAFAAHWGRHHFNLERLGELFRATRVRRRHLALPVDAYLGLGGFGRRNQAYLRVGAELGEAAIRDALARAGLAPRDVDHLFFVTVTGVSTPSLDAHLVNRLGLRPDVKRTPVFGLGCMAGAAGLARASDVLRAFPDQVAVLLSVELCSLTFLPEDGSVANAVAAGLFGDGAAAAVLVGGAHPRRRGPRVTATRSNLYPDTEGVMGWEVVDEGFRVLLSAQVPQVVEAHVGADVDALLGAHGLGRDRIRHWIAHTGGPKVLEAFRAGLGLPAEALARSWRSLEEVGNLSSASVLFVLADLLASGEAAEGDLGLLAALGPGFASELLLLSW